MRMPCWPWGLHPILRAPPDAANKIRAEALAVFLVIAQIFGAIGPAFYGSSSVTGRAGPDLRPDTRWVAPS